MSKQSNQRYRKELEKRYTNSSNEESDRYADEFDTIDFENNSSETSYHSSYNDEFDD